MSEKAELLPCSYCETHVTCEHCGENYYHQTPLPPSVEAVLEAAREFKHVEQGFMNAVVCCNAQEKLFNAIRNHDKGRK